MALRKATADDWIAMFGIDAPAEWFGYVEARTHLVEGLGAIYRAVDGRWWISFSRCPGVHKVKSAHAGARKLLADATERGITVHAIADPKFPGSETWIERLGFTRSAESKEGLSVWTR